MKEKIRMRTGPISLLAYWIFENGGIQAHCKSTPSPTSLWATFRNDEFMKIVHFVSKYFPALQRLSALPAAL